MTTTAKETKMLERLGDVGTRRAKAELERGAAAKALAKVVTAAARGGMTPTQIAQAADVSRQTVHAILANKS